jgi:hypothetical protein
MNDLPCGMQRFLIIKNAALIRNIIGCTNLFLMDGEVHFAAFFSSSI